MGQHHWIILTGEYPPTPGGVSDYTHQLASALVKAGDRVDIWAPALGDGGRGAAAGAGEGTDGGDRVRVHRLCDHFGRRGLRQLTQELDQLGSDARILVQYAPHAFGHKAMNLRLCRWIKRRRGRVWVHFHEVAYPFEHGQRWRHRLLAIVTHHMAKVTARRADRIFVATEAWRPLLERFVLRKPIRWLPGPSCLPDRVDAREAARVRAGFAWKGPVVGHFGTFGEGIGRLLEELLPAILQEDPRCAILLIGRGGREFARKILERFPDLSARLSATGGLAASEAAAHIAACDVMAQPYPDGATCRRGSLMAGLALGRAIVTTTGPLTEPLWKRSDAVVMVDSCAEAAQSIKKLLDDPARRRQIGARAAALYERYFTRRHTVECLRSAADEEEAG